MRVRIPILIIDSPIHPHRHRRRQQMNLWSTDGMMEESQITTTLGSEELPIAGQGTAHIRSILDIPDNHSGEHFHSLPRQLHHHLRPAEPTLRKKIERLKIIKVRSTQLRIVPTSMLYRSRSCAVPECSMFT